MRSCADAERELQEERNYTHPSFFTATVKHIVVWNGPLGEYEISVLDENDETLFVRCTYHYEAAFAMASSLSERFHAPAVKLCLTWVQLGKEAAHLHSGVKPLHEVPPNELLN